MVGESLLFSKPGLGQRVQALSQPLRFPPQLVLEFLG
jgi:hypothetical protein